MNEMDFYQMLDDQKSDDGWIMTFSLNPKHRIFEGHFPGQPILPGVCMVQIVKDAVCRLTGKNCFLAEARQIKFLEMIIPDEKDIFSFRLMKTETEDSCFVQASFEKAGKTVFKFQGSFKLS